MRGITHKTVYFVAAIISILLSCYAFIKIAVINPDGVCYIQSAATMSMGLTTAMHLCGQAQWPFYSMLIFGVMKLTHLPELPAAFLLNGLLTLLSVLTFIAITRLLTQSKRIVWLAAIVILLAHEFNASRTDIIRDHGFWAFYLLSLYCLLNYFQRQRGADALMWSVALVVATLFRIEGAIFLLILPFATWFDQRVSWPIRAKRFFQLNIPTMLGLIILLVSLLGHYSQHSLGRLSEVQYQLMHGLDAISQNFQTKAAALGQNVLSVYSVRDEHLILFLMLVSWYLISVAINISLIYTALVLYAWWKKLLPKDISARLVLWSYVLVNVLITSIFLEENFFLSKRYLMALSLTLMLWVPFALNDLIQQWRVRKWPLIAAIILILFYAVGGIVDLGYSKRYIRDAGGWLASNAPAATNIYTNDFQVMYYSHHFGNTIFDTFRQFNNIDTIAHDKWRHYDYLALRFDKQDTRSIITSIPLQPTRVFMNKRGDEVMIYKIH